MDPAQERQLNQAAYRRQKDLLDHTYPPGRFLAIAGGQVVADADHLDGLRATLKALGKDPARVLIVQAGAEYPETAVIFAWRVRP
jgi:hypothetical protein